MDELHKKREYTPDIIQQVSQMAGNQSTPSHIATNMGYIGEQRIYFIDDILNPKTEIGIAYLKAFALANSDMDSKLQILCLQGDTEAITTLMDKRDRDYTIELRNKLFGL